MSINYVVGDATNPIGDGHKIIAHVNNDIGAWGAGFVLAVSNKWPLAKDCYLHWAAGKEAELPFEMGFVQFVRVETDIWIANMVAQHGVRSAGNPIPLNYAELHNCLEQVDDMAYALKASVHMPRIGCGLAGGNWDTVEGIIKDQLVAGNIETYVYDLPIALTAVA
jgi:O-acetyl-ADP-ribose deacetylase (regulator of RNase III)